MKKFDNEIWTVDGDRMRVFGIPFSTRMTVVRLKSGGLWIHSPVAPTPERRAAVDELGKVEHLVAPDKVHSLWVGPWKKLYPDAKVWASPEFNQRHPNIHVDSLLTDEIETPWRDEIDFEVLAGHSFLDEVIFFHRVSKTLIVTDLIQKHDPEEDPWYYRTLKRFAGVLGKEGGTAVHIRLTFQDRLAAKKSIEKILQWDFDKLIVTHGLCLHKNAKENVKKAFAWLL